jgi:hypothetical protein
MAATRGTSYLAALFRPYRTCRPGYSLVWGGYFERRLGSFEISVATWRPREALRASLLYSVPTGLADRDTSLFGEDVSKGVWGLLKSLWLHGGRARHFVPRCSISSLQDLPTGILPCLGRMFRSLMVSRYRRWCKTLRIERLC